MLFAPARLRPEPVGDPNTWPHAIEEARDHSLSRPGSTTKQQLSAFWNTHSHQLAVPTRKRVSSEPITVPASSRLRIGATCAANAGAAAFSIAASAPSLSFTPNCTARTEASRSYDTAWHCRRCTTVARRFSPQGDPGSIPSGGSALNAVRQHGQVPRRKMTRVMTAGASGISTWSYVAPALCATPDRSAAQCGHVPARMSFTSVGLSHSARCAPAWPRRGCAGVTAGCPLAFGFTAWDGGMLEFRGVFFGRPSLAGRAAISARRRSISASLALPSLRSRSFSARSRPFSACRAAFSSCTR